MSEESELVESLRAEYTQMLVRLERGRERADRLRNVAEQAADQVAADERLVRSLAEVLGISRQTTLDDLGAALRGQRLREVAVEILRQNVRPGDDVHYREWFEMVRAADVAVAGRDPLATFLAQVSRSPAVEALGGRTGRYRLAVVA